MTPAVSVIVPLYNKTLWIDRCLESIARQTYTDYEVIVVADALDAGTASICALHLREQDVFIKRNGRSGPAESRNVGMSLARGEWVIFLDDDDTFKPHHLETTHRRITQPLKPADSKARVLYSDCEVLTEDRAKKPIPQLSRATIPLHVQPIEKLHVNNFIPNNVLVYHRLVLEGCRVDPHLDSLEDWDFLLSVCQKSMPCYYEGGGAVIHKDYVNPGTRRGNSEAAKNDTVLVDFIHIYRRWRAPTPELQAQRGALIASTGMAAPAAWF